MKNPERASSTCGNRLDPKLSSHCLALGCSPAGVQTNVMSAYCFVITHALNGDIAPSVPLTPDHLIVRACSKLGSFAFSALENRAFLSNVCVIVL